MILGRAVRISIEAERDWRAAREQPDDAELRLKSGKWKRAHAQLVTRAVSPPSRSGTFQNGGGVDQWKRREDVPTSAAVAPSSAGAEFISPKKSSKRPILDLLWPLLQSLMASRCGPSSTYESLKRRHSISLRASSLGCYFACNVRARDKGDCDAK